MLPKTLNETAAGGQPRAAMSTVLKLGRVRLVKPAPQEPSRARARADRFQPVDELLVRGDYFKRIATA